MKKRPVWKGWRKRELLHGGEVLANIILIRRGCVIVNEHGWGRGRLKPAYKTIGEAKKAADVWSQRRAVQERGA